MVVISAPSINKICESFTHNSLTRDRVNPIFLSLVGIHKDCIANVSKFESNFGGGNYGCACVAMGDYQYLPRSNILSVHPIKPGRTPAYLLNPTYGYIAVADQ